MDYYKSHQKIVKLNIFPLYYNFLLDTYLKKNSNNLNYLIVDSTFIINKKGSELIIYNPQIKKHKTCKISLIFDEFNIPINFKLNNSLKHDWRTDQISLFRSHKLFQEQLNDITENLNLKNKIFLGDGRTEQNYLFRSPAYDSNKTRELLKNNNLGILYCSKNKLKDNKILLKIIIYMKDYYWKEELK